MKTHDFWYDLPEELIAQDPIEDRSASRLMILASAQSCSRSASAFSACRIASCGVTVFFTSLISR